MCLIEEGKLLDVFIMHLSISALTTPLTGRDGDLKGISNSFSLTVPLPWDTSE